MLRVASMMNVLCWYLIKAYLIIMFDVVKKNNKRKQSYLSTCLNV